MVPAGNGTSCAKPGIIGDCAFQVLPEDARQAQIGFTLSRPYQKQGYASEAVRALVGFLFSEYRLHRITATCDALNLASARLLERIGMRREGQYVENVWFKGAWGDELYAILERYAVLDRVNGEGGANRIKQAKGEEKQEGQRDALALFLFKYERCEPNC